MSNADTLRRLALDSLSPSQRHAAVWDPERPLQILAGPGSGKTRVLTMRAAWLVLGDADRRPIKPENCVVVTFTNRAAREMRSRISAYIGPSMTDRLLLGTFHALCVKFLRRYGRLVGLANNFTICDSDDSIRIIKGVIEQQADMLKESGVTIKAEEARTEISRAKARLQTAEAFRKACPNAPGNMDRHTAMANVYKDYELYLRGSKACDFDDLLLYAERLFCLHPGVCSKIEHVLVDEFQDTNAIQYALMQRLSAASGRVSIVGDPDQSIYSWRNAEVSNLEKMVHDFSGIKRIYLEENFRSTGAILDASLKVVQQDRMRINKGLYTAQAEGAPVTFRTFDTELEETEYVALEIERQMQLARPMLRYADFCILLRFNALSRGFEAALRRRRIPYRMLGGQQFFDRVEIKDLVAYLRVLDNPAYAPGLLRILNVPKRGIGKATISAVSGLASAQRIPIYSVLEQISARTSELSVHGRALYGIDTFVSVMNKLRERVQQGLSVNELLTCVIEVTEYKTYLEREGDFASRWENVRELLTFAALCAGDDEREELYLPPKRTKLDPEEQEEEPTPLRTFLESSALATDRTDDDTNDKVTIATCHAAKGLEWPIVFVAAVEDGTFPFYRSTTPEMIAEERRLLYVAMTRAASNLYLCSTKRRMMAGEWRNQKVSMFVTPLIPCSRGGTGLSAPTKTDAVMWCFTSPLIQDFLHTTARILQRSVPSEEVLQQNRIEYKFSDTCTSLDKLDACRNAALQWRSEMGNVGLPSKSGFLSALNSLGSAALQHGSNLGMRSTHAAPADLQQSHGHRRSMSSTTQNASSAAPQAHPLARFTSNNTAPQRKRALGMH
ncbi:hypothetical protein MVES_000087 [Malassezia vespertilionis]|uniref:DNA 3'-5' helicase n=1 Tax=Malassezia vespertilionis TaxID=2020962 RepID=A0A2N1JHE2_9BASI|nr:hypothetical protein MVES_000087 [Malassezia vespertilionis]